jgi:hypothetical protein
MWNNYKIQNTKCLNEILKDAKKVFLIIYNNISNPIETKIELRFF